MRKRLAVVTMLLTLLTSCASTPDPSDFASSHAPDAGTSSTQSAPSSTLTPEQAASQINNRTDRSVVRLESERQLIYVPEGSWGYNHHAAVQPFKGKLYATFSSGRENEDDCGQRIMLSVSAPAAAA